MAPALGLGCAVLRVHRRVPSRKLKMSFTESAVCDDFLPGQYQLLAAENTIPQETADSAIIVISGVEAKQCR